MSTVGKLAWLIGSCLLWSGCGGSEAAGGEGGAAGALDAGGTRVRRHPIYDDCLNDPLCFEPFRRELLEGIRRDPTNSTSVLVPNDITSRVQALAAHLAANAPSRFAPALEWSRLRVGGTSQGAGHVAFLGKYLRSVERVCMFGGPGDNDIPYCAKTGSPDITPRPGSSAAAFRRASLDTSRLPGPIRSAGLEEFVANRRRRSPAATRSEPRGPSRRFYPLWFSSVEPPSRGGIGSGSGRPR